MRNRLDQEIHWRKFRAAEFALPMQKRKRVVLGASQIAVHLVQEGAAASGQQVVSVSVLYWVAVHDNGRTARDDIDEAAHHARMGSHLGARVFVVAFEESRAGVDNHQAK